MLLQALFLIFRPSLIAIALAVILLVLISALL
jgi:hypothetical protein